MMRCMNRRIPLSVLDYSSCVDCIGRNPHVGLLYSTTGASKYAKQVYKIVPKRAWLLISRLRWIYRIGQKRSGSMHFANMYTHQSET